MSRTPTTSAATVTAAHPITPTDPPTEPTPITPTFPASITNPERGRSRRRRRIAAAAGTVVVLAAGGVAATHASATPATTYRTGTASAQHIDQLLTSVAVLEPVSQASVAFPRSGTVATVDVATGARVTAGQTLATLDATDLTDAVESKQVALATAQTNLADAYAGTTTSSTSTGSTSSGSTSSGSTGTGTASAPAATGATGSATAPTGTAATGTAASSGSTSTASSTTTAATLTSLQHAVDVAAAELAVAQQAVTQATIVSPIAGTVAQVDLAVGDPVTAASTTSTIVVVGDGGLEATTTVGIDDLSKVAVGQAATVVPDGAKDALTGKVSSISVSPDASSTTTAYRVFIALDGDTSKLGNGSTGSVAIVTSSADAAVAVPTSAVATTGTDHTVTTFDGTTTSVVRVQVGTVGDTWTQITSGLTGGQRVVLADLTTPLPSSATEATTTNRLGQGAPGAGAFPGGAGGFPAGGPPAR